MAQMTVPTYSSRAADANMGANLVMSGTSKSLDAAGAHAV